MTYQGLLLDLFRSNPFHVWTLFIADGVSTKGSESHSVPCHDPADREDLLLQILKTGLPKPATANCKKDVTIVGAGISGLAGYCS
jgi:hypothetical protein